MLQQDRKGETFAGMPKLGQRAESDASSSLLYMPPFSRRADKVGFADRIRMKEAPQNYLFASPGHEWPPFYSRVGPFREQEEEEEEKVFLLLIKPAF